VVLIHRFKRMGFAWAGLLAGIAIFAACGSTPADCEYRSDTLRVGARVAMSDLSSSVQAEVHCSLPFSQADLADALAAAAADYAGDGEWTVAEPEFSRYLSIQSGELSDGGMTFVEVRMSRLRLDVEDDLASPQFDPSLELMLRGLAGLGGFDATKLWDSAAAKPVGAEVWISDGVAAVSGWNHAELVVLLVGTVGQ